MLSTTCSFSFSNFECPAPDLPVPLATVVLAPMGPPARPPVVQAAPVVPAPVAETTLADVIRLYRRIASCAPRTVKTNILSIEKVLERATGKNRKPEHVALSMVNKALVAQYQESVVADYCAKAGKDDAVRKEARERALRSSRSTIQQARCLFASRDVDLLDRYITAGLRIPPCVREFVECKLRGRLWKPTYNPPDETVIDRAFVEIEEKRDTDRALYLAFWLAVGAGLRKGEIRNCRWEHVIVRDGRTWVSGGLGKDSLPINVPLQARAAEAIGPLRKDSGPIVTGDQWCKRLNRWMVGLGWATQKKTHELRALVGSRIYQKDPVAAMRFLRHKSYSTTEKFYVRYSLHSRPIDVL